MNIIENEKKFLEDLFNNYIKSSDSSYLRLMRDSMIKKCKPYMHPQTRALELGCEIGYMTSLISPLVDSLDVYDGSESFIAEAKKKNLKNVTFYNKLFEELSVRNEYDYIFMSHVVEHLINPVIVLEKVRMALKPGGYLFITVPSATALSRQLARAMGLLDDLYALTPNDIRGGHRRVYDAHTIREELSAFHLHEVSGILLKPFCDFQMDHLIDSGFLSEIHLDGLLKLGENYPGICGDIFICARRIK